MPVLRKMTSLTPVFSLPDFEITGAGAKYYFEDGWVFREHHGLYVECVCRVEDAERNNIPLPRGFRRALNGRAA